MILRYASEYEINFGGFTASKLLNSSSALWNTARSELLETGRAGATLSFTGLQPSARLAVAVKTWGSECGMAAQANIALEPTARPVYRDGQAVAQRYL